MMRALRAEFLKLKRSRMPLWTALGVAGYTAINLVMMPVLKDREKMGELMTTAGGEFGRIAMEGFYLPTWDNMLRLGAQGISGAWGLYLFGLAAAYVFGREFKEGASNTLLTLPLRRENIVAAKLVVVAAWSLGLTLLSVVLHLGVVAAVGAEGFAWSLVSEYVVDSLAVALLIFLAMPFVAWFAQLGRGYLPPMLFCVAVTMTGMAFVQQSAEWSRYFPFSMWVDYMGTSWIPEPPAPLVAGSWVVAVTSFAAGVALLMWRADRADAGG